MSPSLKHESNIKIRHFKTGPPEHWLETMDDLEPVIKGSQVTTAKQAKAVLHLPAPKSCPMPSVTAIGASKSKFWFVIVVS
jgi:hypothetical protein